MISKFLKRDENTYTNTVQDLMDDVGHEIHRLLDLERQTVTNVQKDITLLRMFKSDLRNLVKRYETLELLIKGGKK